MSKVILLLGSNLGDREKFLNKAIELIKLNVGLILKCSSVYESEPWGFTSENLFLNQVIIIETSHKSLMVLRKLQTIEKELGRKIKSNFYQNRTIDIDILFYDDIKLESKKLIIPHPQLHLRKFTMLPLIEIAGDLVHPVFGERLKNLALSLSDTSTVRLIKIAKTPSSIVSYEL